LTGRPGIRQPSRRRPGTPAQWSWGGCLLRLAKGRCTTAQRLTLRQELLRRPQQRARKDHHARCPVSRLDILRLRELHQLQVSAERSGQGQPTDHSRRRVENRHVLEDRRTVVCNDHLARARRDLSAQLWLLVQARPCRSILTILSIPFGPKLVRTASDTATESADDDLALEVTAHLLPRSYWTSGPLWVSPKTCQRSCA
jgi:hypothetical protein